MARTRAINLRAAVPTANRKADFEHGSDQNQTQKQKQKQSEKQTQSEQQQKQSRPAELSFPAEKSRQGEQRRKPTQSPLDKLKGPATATGAALLAVAGGSRRPVAATATGGGESW